MYHLYGYLILLVLGLFRWSNYGRPVSIFFSLPNLSGHRLDVYHTSTHGVALVQI